LNESGATMIFGERIGTAYGWPEEVTEPFGAHPKKVASDSPSPVFGSSSAEAAG
jgi:hypothetical protein